MKKSAVTFWIAMALLIVLGFPLFIPPVYDIQSGYFASQGRTLVIDPGHGGEDGGATSPGGAKESELNLDIALKLDMLMGLFGVRTVLTRSSENIEYPPGASTVKARKAADTKARCALVNAAENAVLISIHQNKYTTAQPHGAQVFFAPSHGSREFAEFLQETLRSAVEPENHRLSVQIQKDIYLMNNVACPAVLIECGFLSNPADEAKLKTDSYRLKLAWAAAGGFLGYSGGTNES